MKKYFPVLCSLPLCVFIMTDPIALINSLTGIVTGFINGVKDLITELKDFGNALKDVFDPSIATNPLTFPAGSYQRAVYLGDAATQLIAALTNLYDLVDDLIP